MTPAPTKGTRLATVSAMQPPAYPPPSGPPPQLPSGHPSHQGQFHSGPAFQPQQYQQYTPQQGYHHNPYQQQPILQGYPTYQQDTRSSFVSASTAAPPQPPASTGPLRPASAERQDSRSDGGWRAIFDAALVKAQQAVQLDELGESSMASGLYQQAANDLGRVIPLCGSEKKKQSMLAIQAIYLDRVLQLKNPQSKTAQAAPAPAPAPTPSRIQTLPQALPAPIPTLPQSNGHVMGAYGLEQEDEETYQPQDDYLLDQYQQYNVTQFQHQQQYQQQQQQQQQQHQQQQHQQQPQQQPQMDMDRGSMIMGKKRSLTQPSAAHPPEFLQQPTITAYNGFDDPSYGDYSSGSRNPSPFNGATTTPSPPPPAVSVSSVFKTDAKAEQESSKSSSSRWKPFGKKKSKSFSHSEPQPSGPYVPPNDYEVPVPALPSSTLPLEPTQGTMNGSVPNHLGVDPLNHNGLYASQHTDWFMGEAESPFPDENGFNENNRYIDDEDEDVDPYYIADTKGRAHAFEGKNDSKPKAAPPKEVAVAPLRIKPATQHTGASFASDKPFSPTFSPQDFGLQQDRGQVFGYAQEQIHGAYYSQEPMDMQSNDHEHGIRHQDEASLEYYQHQHLQQRQQQLHDQQQLQHIFELQQQQQQLQQQQYQFQQQQQQQQQQQHQQQQQQPQQPQQNGSTHGRDLEMMLSITSTPGLEPDFVLETEQGQESAEQDESKSKRNWFGKKKKKDSAPAPADKLDNVAKLMDEALFGGSPSPSSSRQNKVKETPAPMMTETQEASAPTTTGPFIAPRKDSLVEYEGRLSYIGGHGPSLDAGYREDSRHASYVKERTGPPMMAPIQAAHIPQSDVSLTSTADPMSMPLALPPFSAPLNYAPRTTYIPTPKKQPTEVEEVVSLPMALPSGLPDYNPESAGLQGSDTLLSEPLSLTTESPKKSKNKPFSLFKSKKSNGNKLSLEQDPGTPLSPTFNSFGDDARSMHSDKKSSIHSNDRRAAMNPVPPLKDTKKKRESDEYVPYEYQEELEGPLMERVEVPENRDVIGFVMPVEEIIDYTIEGNDDAALDNWDSWVNQLESFEKVLSDKGMKKDKGKKAKKSKKEKEKEKQEALAAAAAAATTGADSSSSSPFSSVKANRSSVFSSSTGRQSTSTAFDDDPHRRQSTVSQGDESTSLSHRHSFQSSRSTVILGGEQVQVQQAKKRWWNPKRKETTSMYSVSDTFSVSEMDQERYLSTLLQNHQDQQRQVSGDLSQTISAHLPANDTEREDALAALLENSRTVMSLPIPSMLSPTSSVVTTQEIQSSPLVGTADSNELAPEVTTTPEPIPIADSTELSATTVAKEPQTTSVATTAPKVKAAKSNKPKLLPISTPLAQILEISNPEELWLYVQQAKTYAATRMNKGDKRSAAIALKRAQALEARWQEILLEMASSDEEDDELLDDDDDEDEDDSDEEDTPAAVAPSKAPTASLVVVPTIAAAAATSAPPVPAESDGEDEERSRILRPPTSRSDSAPDMYSKYKVSIKSPETPKDESSHAEEPVEANKDVCSGDDGRLGPEATLDEMLASTNKDHLQFYIQRLKTDTVAKARKGSKFAALEGMKDVKVLQQRLSELEEQSEEGAVESS